MSHERVLLLGSGELSLGEPFQVVTADPASMDADGSAHVVADGAACADGCWRAIRHPEQVRRVVLVRPACPDEALTQRLGDIQAETLVLLDSTAPPNAGQVYQQRIPRAYRFFVYTPRGFTTLIADFLRRGDTFVVNTGETRSW